MREDVIERLSIFRFLYVGQIRKPDVESSLFLKFLFEPWKPIALRVVPCPVDDEDVVHREIIACAARSFFLYYYDNPTA